MKRVLVIGLDGLEPTIVDRLLARGELPHLARVREAGGYARVATTCPAQTPVAWSTFATGANPGGHGIFDFIRRDPATYLPDISLNRYEQKNAFLPPKAVNLRRGTPLWSVLADAGVRASVLRCPCTYPPDPLKGRMLSGMGVPDVRGGFGTSTFYTSADGVTAGESETVVPVRIEDGTVATQLIGPRHPKKGGEMTLPLTITVDREGGRVVIRSEGTPTTLAVELGTWSDWLKVKFKAGMLQSVAGMVRFHLVALEPHVALYASPVNFDPHTPMFAISAPWDYADELEREIGTFYTTGMVEDHTGLNNERFGEEAYLDQCAQVMDERERMMEYELNRLDEGFFFCLFDTPDRLQHMFWRFQEPGHPANRNGNRPAADFRGAIDEQYRRCDAVVGKALAHADDDTLVIVLSDHGFGSFQRGVHLNTWLHEAGYLTLRNGAVPGNDVQDFLRDVDWGQTQAYALGMGSIYLNIEGREAEGVVAPGQRAELAGAIAERLSGLEDEERGEVAVRSVVTGDAVYRGPYANEAPDLVVNFGAGYRASWETALGGTPAGLIEDNTKRWGGDHIVDPALVPGVLFMNRPFRGEEARLLDLAPTILDAFGVPKGAAMEGDSLLS